jgi:hypothetical protein
MKAGSLRHAPRSPGRSPTDRIGAGESASLKEWGTFECRYQADALIDIFLDGLSPS